MVHDHTTEDPEPEFDTGIIWMFLAAGAVAVIIQLAKYLIKILEK